MKSSKNLGAVYIYIYIVSFNETKVNINSLINKTMYFRRI